MRHLVTLAFAAMFAISGTALAAGGGGTTTTSPTTLKCKKGDVVKEIVKNGTKKKICVKATSGVLPDEELYQQGRLLAKQGQYDWALQVFGIIQNQNDPRVLNYQGYSNRKAGRLELGISYYRKALAINPNFVLAREYLGEGYVAAGRTDLAKAQLAEIEKRCGTTCEEYKDLSEAIAGAH
ncbi:MAG TPA: tetratricopeptide repeat protein [Aestuariivirga sp.]|nr:tetratricopeptide repeat protein [Aestuariivirga sp.]